jgi:hypothetical protein
MLKNSANRLLLSSKTQPTTGERIAAQAYAFSNGA